ncbi:hypothetical protein, partial [Paenibacillus sp. EPM92]|uniref:hypothetical protein n=1 Tax=Paenibacillus sp. EPM92 TaxID=1561195 RepID=UPI001914EF12
MPDLNNYSHSMSINPSDGKIMPNMQIAGSNVEGTSGAAAPAKGILIGGTDGTNFRTLYVPNSIGSAGGDAWSMSVSGMVTKSGMLANNGATWDNWRNNTQGTLLASAPRTAITASPVQTNYNARGVLIHLYVSAASGTGGLTLRIAGYDPVTGFTMYLNSTPTAITATGISGYMLYPGIALGTTVNMNQVIGVALPRTWKVDVFHGDTSSYTYSVGFSLIL